MDEESTGYHASVTDMRRQLVEASTDYFRKAEVYMEKMHPHDGREPELLTDDERLAHVGLTMAGSYAYTLAAVLRLIGEQASPEVMQAIASEADSILTNGDFEDVNADVAS